MPLPTPASPTAASSSFVECFHEQHEASYGYRIASERIEVTGCSVTASGRGLTLPRARGERPAAQAAQPHRREVDDGTARKEWPVYRREALSRAAF